MEIAAPRPARRRSHVKGTDEIAEKAPMFRRFRAECPRNAPRFASIAVFAFSSDYRPPYYATVAHTLKSRNANVLQYSDKFNTLDKDRNEE